MTYTLLFILKSWLNMEFGAIIIYYLVTILKTSEEVIDLERRERQG